MPDVIPLVGPSVILNLVQHNISALFRVPSSSTVSAAGPSPTQPGPGTGVRRAPAPSPPPSAPGPSPTPAASSAAPRTVPPSPSSSGVGLEVLQAAPSPGQAPLSQAATLSRPFPSESLAPFPSQPEGQAEPPSRPSAVPPLAIKNLKAELEAFKVR